MKGAKEVDLVELPAAGGLPQFCFACPHCGEKIHFSANLEPFVIAVLVDPCSKESVHTWMPVRRERATRRKA